MIRVFVFSILEHILYTSAVAVVVAAVVVVVVVVALLLIGFCHSDSLVNLIESGKHLLFLR